MGDQGPAPRLPIGDGIPTPRPPVVDDGRRSRRLPFTQLGQADKDFVLAETLQEQERAFMMLTMDREGGDGNIGDSEADDSADDEDNSSSDEDFSADHDEMEEVEEDWQLEDLGEEDRGYQDNGEDSSDQELSYEELLALEEVIGSESRGMPTDVIDSLPYSTYKLPPVSNDTLTQCVICQFDYEEGEKLMLLSCDHSYHWECINKWLQMSKVCPICGKEVASSTPV